MGCWAMQAVVRDSEERQSEERAHCDWVMDSDAVGRRTVATGGQKQRTDGRNRADMGRSSAAPVQDGGEWLGMGGVWSKSRDLEDDRGYRVMDSRCEKRWTAWGNPA